MIILLQDTFSPITNISGISSAPTSLAKDLFNFSDLYDSQNQNPIQVRVFNSDWFFHSDNGTERFYGPMFPQDFDNMRFSFTYMPVIHENSFMALPNGSIIMNPPPIFVPSISVSVLFVFATLLLVKRPARLTK